MSFLHRVLQRVIKPSDKMVDPSPVKSRLVLYVPIALVLVVSVISLTVFFGPVFDNEEPSHQRQLSTSADGFVVTADYLGERNWSFKVEGSFSNHCVNSEVVAEEPDTASEEVTVRLITYRPTDETLCAQKVQKVSHEGTFVASRDASLKMEIDERESKKSPTGLELKNL